MSLSLDAILAGASAPAPAITTTAVEALPVPDLKLPLLPYQNETVEFALRRRESYLALDMGLGKTACAIAIAAALAKAGETPTLVVVPPSLRRNWQQECLKFAPTLRVEIITGTKPHALPSCDIIVIGDSSLSAWAVKDPTKRSVHDLHGKVACLIVDEAHRHKNKSKRAEALVSLADSVPGKRILMSGTPIPNGRTMEMANQLSILGSGAWRAIGGSGYFWQHYAPKAQYGRDSVDLQGLGEAMRSSFMVRRKRDEVLTLPNKGRASVAVDGRGDAVRRYKSAEMDLISYLKASGKSWEGAARAEAIVKLNTLRQLAGIAKVRSIIEHVEELLTDSPGGVFVVAEHVEVMNELALGLMKFGVASIRGGMSDSAKDEAKQRFNSGDARVLIGQITSAGVGLTLHGDGRNHHVVIAQLPWTPAELRQAEDRLHRIGQTHDVTVDVTLCHVDGLWTIDERLWGVLEEKAFNTSLVIDGEGEFLLDEAQSAVLDSYR